MPKDPAKSAQLEIPWRDGPQLAADIEAAADMSVDLTLTDNRSRMISMRHDPRDGVVRLRLHRMFLNAGPAVVADLARWLKHPRSKSAGREVDAFLRAHMHLAEAKPPRAQPIATRGAHHDLRALFDEVNAAEFSGAVDARITWGRMPGQRRRRSIRMGSYSAAEHLIRMHPKLDQACVPHWFVRYVVFHEMLHAYLGIEEGPTGRRRIHPPEFRERERAYADYEHAQAWESDPANLRKLLR